MALTGLWGEGKTSVINLVESALVERHEAVVVHFNPWLFSGTEQLVEHFFEELISQLQETGIEKLGRVASALEMYGRVVAPLRYCRGSAKCFARQPTWRARAATA